MCIFLTDTRCVMLHQLTVSHSIAGIRDFASDAAQRPAEDVYGHVQPSQTSDTVKYDSSPSDLPHVEASTASRPAAVLTSGVPAFMASLLPQVGASKPCRLLLQCLSERSYALLHATSGFSHTSQSSLLCDLQMSRHNMALCIHFASCQYAQHVCMHTSTLTSAGAGFSYVHTIRQKHVLMHTSIPLVFVEQ